MRRSSLKKAADSVLIARASKGDREAFGVLYERYVYKVFRHVYYLASNRQTAEDITAQTFLNALEAIHRYEQRGVSFLAWLLRIAYNLTMNHKKARANDTTPLSKAPEIEGSRYLPEAAVVAKAQGEETWDGIKKLRGDQRDVIVMRFLDGLSYSDIATVMGKKIGTVRVIQYRALSALRRRLGEDVGRYYARSRAG